MLHILNTSLEQPFHITIWWSLLSLLKTFNSSSARGDNITDIEDLCCCLVGGTSVMFSNPSGISLIPSTQYPHVILCCCIYSSTIESLCTICLMFKYITTRWMMTAGTRVRLRTLVSYINLWTCEEEVPTPWHQFSLIFLYFSDASTANNILFSFSMFNTIHKSLVVLHRLLLILPQSL